MDIPRELVEQIARGNAVLFAGAGLSMGAGLPGWAQLLTPLADKIGLSPGRRADLLQVAQFYENSRGRQALVSHILEQLDTTGRRPTENHRRLRRLGIRTWITTNYDDLLERTLREADERFSIVVRDQDLPYTSGDAITVVKLHGDRAQPDTLIITRNDYNTYFRRFPIVRNKLAVLLAEKTFVFVGYSINDPDLNQIKDEIAFDLQHHQRAAYALLFDTDELSVQDLRGRNIHVLDLGASAGTDISERLGVLLDDLIRQIDALRGGKVAPIVASLDLLASFMQRPEVRDIVVVFRTHFETARDQVRVLDHYKELHDALHDLQFRCFNVVAREVERFPEDPASIENLMDHRQTFQRIVSRVRTVAAQPSMPVPPKLIQGLEEALGRLDEAIEKSSRAPLDDACNLVQHVLSIYPSKFNERLCQAAENLRLNDMHQDMDSIWQKLQGMNFTPDQVSQFEQGVVSLGAIKDRLDRLVAEHDQWQGIDVEFRLVEAGLGSDLEKAQEHLIKSWPELKAGVAPLCQDYQADWVQALDRDRANLDKALAVRDPNKSKLYFQSYRRGVAQRFYDVDKDLKDLSGELCYIAGPLKDVLSTFSQKEWGHD